jgi:uncharacterized membrane protein
MGGGNLRGYNAAIEKAERDRKFERVVGQVVFGICLLLGSAVVGILTGFGVVGLVAQGSPAVVAILNVLTP